MCWKPEYAVLLLFSTAVDYYSGIKMGEAKSEPKKRKFLLLSLISNLSLLFTFKYLNFLDESARTLLNHFNILYNIPYLNVLLPVGISFYTFQSLSYSMDVYRGETKPEKQFGIFALYVSFFPQLIAGPIERSTRLLPQFLEKKIFDYNRVTSGLSLMLWGYFKKIVIADRLALYVNQVYNNPSDYHGFHILTATYFFAFQIYCDFSGYSDIAIGSAKVLGYDLMENFRTPYFSKDITEFWRRWHISLSSWFRDYVFLPLNFKLRYYNLWGAIISLLVTFLLCGIWHGANWTFVVWGGLHGVYFVSSILTKNIRSKLNNLSPFNKTILLQKLVKVFITFQLISLGWLFFRANSISDAILLLRNLAGFNLSQIQTLALSLGSYEMLIAVSSIIFLVIIHLAERKNNFTIFLSSRPLWVRYAFYYILFFGILLFGQFKQTEFIYFQF